MCHTSHFRHYKSRSLLLLRLSALSTEVRKADIERDLELDPPESRRTAFVPGLAQDPAESVRTAVITVLEPAESCRTALITGVELSLAESLVEVEPGEDSELCVRLPNSSTSDEA